MQLLGPRVAVARACVQAPGFSTRLGGAGSDYAWGASLWGMLLGCHHTPSPCAGRGREAGSTGSACACTAAGRGVVSQVVLRAHSLP